MVQSQERENEIDVSKPWMSDCEINLIKSYLRKDKNFFEWGAGGSTLEFSKYVKEYYSVEHDFEWYNSVLKKTGKNVKLFYIPANAPDLKWFPVFKEGEYGDFRNYIEFVDLIGGLDKKFDVVLIDGRARVDCAIEVLPYLSDDAIIFIHDFDRQHYWEVLEYYEIIDIVDKLVALKKKINRGDGVNDRGLLIERYLIGKMN